MVLRKLFRISGLLRAAVISGVIFYTVYLVFVRRNFFFETQKTELIFRDIKRSEEQKTGNEDEHLRNEKETVVNGEQHAGNDKENLRKNEIWSSLKFVGSSFLIPDDETLRKLTEAEQLTMYWKYINTVQVLCKNQTRVGKLADGGKEVCTDDIYKPQKPCIVYSFGSNYQFDFDVPMHNFYGCDVFTYDPSMYIRGRKMPKEIKFELRGLAEKDYTNEKNWKLSTLKTIVQDNKHENSIIDILKIDVEGAEWKSLPPAIEAGVLQRVKQILIELHASRMGPKMDKGFWGDVDLAGQLRVLRLLHEAGFRIFMREHNMYSITDFAVPPENQITIVNEISLININFKKDLVND